MIYVDKDGGEHVFRNPVLVEKTLTVVTYSGDSLPIASLIKLIWKHAGYNCVKIKYRSYFRHEDKGQAYSFDLFFQVGTGLPYKDKRALNSLMWEIEQDAIETFGVFLARKDSIPHSHKPPGSHKPPE